MMGSDRVTDPIVIEEQLHRILSSPEFDATARQKNSCALLPKCFLKGGPAKSKATPSQRMFLAAKRTLTPARTPSSASKQGGFVGHLEHYYLTAGRRDRVQITIPKGGYVPSFLFQTGAESSSSSPGTEPDKNEPADPWPSVLIRRSKIIPKVREPITWRKDARRNWPSNCPVIRICECS
jgi:hypothetical protein